MWRSMLVVAGLLGALLAGSHAYARTPTPTASSVPSALARPTEVLYDAGLLRWVDRADGEAGYRVEVTIGDHSRTFDLPANSTTLELPADFRPGCAPPAVGSSIEVAVVAFNAETQSEPGGLASGFVCGPAKPTVVPPSPSSLPTTGSGALPARQDQLTVIAIILVGCLGLLALARGVSRPSV